MKCVECKKEITDDKTANICRECADKLFVVKIKYGGHTVLKIPVKEYLKKYAQPAT